MNESRYAVDRIEVNGIETYVLRNEVTKAEARLATSLGNNCYSFGILVNDEWIDLIDPPPNLETLRKEPTKYGVPILFPFPNRIRGGKFTFEGSDHPYAHITSKQRALMPVSLFWNRGQHFLA
jgi:aldose 1-epimerase